MVRSVGLLVPAVLVIACGSTVDQSCVGEACDATDSGGSTGTSTTGSSSEAGSDEWADDDRGDLPGPICIVAGEGGVVGFCDLPWSCEADDECPDGFICDELVCEQRRTCEVIEDCFEDEQCIDGVCRTPSCVLDSDCEAGWSCFANVCTPREVLPACEVVAAFSAADVDVAGPFDVTDLAVVGLSTPTIAVGYGGGAVDLLRTDAGVLMPWASASTSPGSGRLVAGTGLRANAELGSLLSDGDPATLVPPDGDFASAIVLPGGAAVDVAGALASATAYTLGTTATTATVRAWEDDGVDLVESASESWDTSGSLLGLSDDGSALVVVLGDRAVTLDPIALTPLETFADLTYHPAYSIAVEPELPGQVIAMVLGPTPILAVYVERELQRVVEVPASATRVAVGHADDDGAPDVALATSDGVFLVRGASTSDACTQTIALDGGVGHVIFAELDDDPVGEIVAASATRVFTIDRE